MGSLGQQTYWIYAVGHPVARGRRCLLYVIVSMVCLCVCGQQMKLFGRIGAVISGLMVTFGFVGSLFLLIRFETFISYNSTVLLDDVI